MIIIIKTIYYITTKTFDISNDNYKKLAINKPAKKFLLTH